MMKIQMISRRRSTTFRRILATVLVVTASAAMPLIAKDTDRHYGTAKRQTTIVRNVRIYNATDHDLYVYMQRDEPRGLKERIQPHSSRTFRNLKRTGINTGKDQAAWPRLTIGFHRQGVCPENDFAEVQVTPIEYQVRGMPGKFGQTWSWHHVRSYWHSEPDMRYAAPAIRRYGDHKIKLEHGKVWHSMWGFRGMKSWSSFGDINSELAFRRTHVLRFDAAVVGRYLHVVAVTGDGGVWHAVRNPDGYWRGYGNVNREAGYPGRAYDVDCRSRGNSEVEVTVYAGGRRHQTVRRPNRTWTRFRRR